MSPALEGEHEQLMGHQAGPIGEGGPYEMSAAKSVNRPGYQVRSASGTNQ
jgi:hypothetical protein